MQFHDIELKPITESGLAGLVGGSVPDTFGEAASLLAVRTEIEAQAPSLLERAWTFALEESGIEKTDFEKLLVLSYVTLPAFCLEKFSADSEEKIHGAVVLFRKDGAWTDALNSLIAAASQLPLETSLPYESALDSLWHLAHRIHHARDHIDEGRGRCRLRDKGFLLVSTLGKTKPKRGI